MGGLVPTGDSAGSWERYKPKNSRSALKPGAEEFAILFASMSRLAIRVGLPVAAELVSGSIRSVLTARFQCNSVAAHRGSHIAAKATDKFVVERIHRDKKVSERDSCQFFIDVKIDNGMRISASVVARHMP